jgi:hypothetical protein
MTRNAVRPAVLGIRTLIVQVDEHGGPVMRPATFRLPPAMLEWLEHAAGRDREGKSGIVRRALQEYRERQQNSAA